MSNELSQSLRDAIALSTLLADAVESGADWNEALVFARERLEEDGVELVMAQAHLLMQTLKALRDLVNQLDDVEVDGIDRPASLLSLLAQFGASVAQEVEGDD